MSFRSCASKIMNAFPAESYTAPSGYLTLDKFLQWCARGHAHMYSEYSQDARFEERYKLLLESKFLAEKFLSLPLHFQLHIIGYESTWGDDKDFRGFAAAMDMRHRLWTGNFDTIAWRKGSGSTNWLTSTLSDAIEVLQNTWQLSDSEFVEKIYYLDELTSIGNDAIRWRSPGLITLVIYGLALFYGTKVITTLVDDLVASRQVYDAADLIEIMEKWDTMKEYPLAWVIQLIQREEPTIA